jgi:hypothetical protein
MSGHISVTAKMTRETSKYLSTSEDSSLIIRTIYFKISEKKVEEIFLKVNEFTDADVIADMIAEVHSQNFFYDREYEPYATLEGKETSVWKETRVCREGTVRQWRISSMPQSSHLAFGYGDVIFFGSEEEVSSGGYVLRRGINSDCPLSLEEVRKIIQIYETEDFENYVDLGNPAIVR